MKQTRDIMGMPVTIEVVGGSAPTIEAAFAHLRRVDETFSTYKPESEISRLNRGELAPHEYSDEMNEILALAEETKQETGGYFDIRTPAGTLDPSGVVKGWAIKGAAEVLRGLGCQDFFVDAGGDIQMSGRNAEGTDWSVGIRNPFNHEEIVKVIYPRGRGVATSGTYARGRHIYDPHRGEPVAGDIISLTVVGPDVCEADRLATAAFAMGRPGLEFIAGREGFEGYMIDAMGQAAYTAGFDTLTT